MSVIKIKNILFYLPEGLIVLLLLLSSCTSKEQPVAVNAANEFPYTIDVTLTDKQTHDKFSAAIPYQVKVASGSVVEAFAKEATGGQLHKNSTLNDWEKVDFDKIHTLTGPIYVEDAMPGDVLAVEILDLQPGDWGWTALSQNFGFLKGEHTSNALKTFTIDNTRNEVRFSDQVTIPLQPFLGVIGVAPPSKEMMVTFPPRANGGNMDDPSIVKGVTVYLPVFVEGGLLSIGDPHAVQGLGEVVGTAIECDMRAVFRVSVLKNKTIEEPQYESEAYYATTGFGTTIDEAAKKATRFMVRHISDTYQMSWEDAYMLCSLVGDLKIAEVVDLPHMLVTMHVPKSIFK